MKSQLYIPKKLKIGYQNRQGTFTGKLAYIIYFDDKNVLRKEKSWESWRDKKIEPNEVDNIPMSGFVINKDVSRYNWGHFSSNKSYIRIHDPRGFEFEITPENLIGILMNGDCSRRTLIGDFVYSWHGTDLVLLPCDSEEYQSSAKFTELQANKVGAKDLLPGHVYETKKQEKVTYIGRFPWYSLHEIPETAEEQQKRSNSYNRYNRTELLYRQRTDKRHIFLVGDKIEPKTSLDFLARRISTEEVSNYAELMDQFNALRVSSKIIGMEIRPVEFSTETAVRWNHVKLKYEEYYKLESDGFMRQYNVHHSAISYCGDTRKYVPTSDTFIFDKGRGFYFKDGVITSKYYDENKDRGFYSYRKPEETRHYTAEQLNREGFHALYLLLENGKDYRVESVCHYDLF